ncbi:MAG: GNAT family N-acetyltransferase [Holophaga sp.]|nr:GNAT family N-acetyltransferase [Holophaga sp.]
MSTLIEPVSEPFLPQCAVLLGLLFAQEVEFQPDPAAQLRGLRRIFADPARGKLLLARDGEEVVGMVSLLWSTSTALGAPVAWLEDLVVAPLRRRQGLGRALVAAALELCRERGIARITLLTDGDNDRAQALYAAMGFRPSRMVPMRLLL